MIQEMPLEIDPPSPMPAPPLRKRPFINPQINMTPHDDPSLRLYINERWN